MAAAHAFACALAENADFGIAPAIDGIADHMYVRHQFGLERHRIDRAPAGAVGDAGNVARCGRLSASE